MEALKKERDFVASQTPCTQQQMERLVDEYGNGMLRLCCMYLGDVHLAQDAVQDAFVKIYRAWPAIPDAAAEKAWAMKITVNVCKDYLRSAWKRRVSLVDQYPELPAGQEPRSEEGRLIQEIMALKPKYREVILLHYYQQLRVGEIAAILGAPQSTVSIRLHRARELLKKRLEGGPYEDL